MNDLTPTLYPVDIAQMSVAQLAALAPAQKLEIDTNLDQAMDWLRKARKKFNAALDQCYGERARAALQDKGEDFGTVHINDGFLSIKFELPKRVSWDQEQLTQIAQRYVAAGERVEHYMDIDLSVPENRFKNWAPAMQAQFNPARTVAPGKPVFTLSMDGEAA